jgi:hypothetical protein
VSNSAPIPDADVEVLEKPGRAFNRTTKFAVLTIALGPTVAGVTAGLGLLVYAYYHRDAWPIAQQAVWILTSLGLIAFGITYVIFFAEAVGGKYLASVVRSDVRRRLEAIVDPSQSEVIFVERVPRENWTKAKLLDSDEFGFLYCDQGQRCVLFEGNSERWKIPACSIVSVEIETYFPPTAQADQGSQERYMVVLRAQASEGGWEAPLARMRMTLAEVRDKNSRHRNAMDLCSQIREIQ